MSASGTFCLLSGQYFLSNALKGEDVGLDEVDDEIWSIVYYNTILRPIDLQTGRITGNDKLKPCARTSVNHQPDRSTSDAAIRHRPRSQRRTRPPAYR